MEQIIVWNVKDIIGLGLFSGLIVGVALMLLYVWIEEKVIDWKRNRKN